MKADNLQAILRKGRVVRSTRFYNSTKIPQSTKNLLGSTKIV